MYMYMGRVWPDHRSLFGNSKFFSQAKVRMGWIYLIRNKVNGKSYVGQTIKKRVEQRWSSHRLYPRACLKNAFAKYGLENFEFSTICEIPEGEGWRELMNAREILEIKERNTIAPNGYNMESGGNRNYTVHEETRKKMSNSRRGSKNHNFGKHLTEQTKTKLRESHISENNPKIGKEVEQWSKDRKVLIEVHTSLASAARKLSRTPDNISRCCCGRRPSAYGFYWKLREQEPV